MSDISLNDEPPVAPQRPGNGECCGSGCNPCIYDLYAQELERYRAALQTWEARQAGAPSSPVTKAKRSLAKEGQ